MMNNLELLRKVLSVPSKTYQEDLLVKFICNWLSDNGIPYYLDDMKNIYATKQTSQDIDFFPCVIAHTDTVHDLEPINIIEEMLPNAQGELKKSWRALNDEGKPTGIGGDNKCGVFACMVSLLELDNVKSAFFVSEETGCHGSKAADAEFFSNVGYCIQFDAPENNMISEYLMGKKMFNRDSKFFEVGHKLICENFPSDPLYQYHPYTDIFPLNQNFGLSCFNLSIGYYRYHTRHEYVVLEDTYNGILIGKKIIEELGCSKH